MSPEQNFERQDQKIQDEQSRIDTLDQKADNKVQDNEALTKTYIEKVNSVQGHLRDVQKKLTVQKDMKSPEWQKLDKASQDVAEKLVAALTDVDKKNVEAQVSAFNGKIDQFLKDIDTIKSTVIPETAKEESTIPTTAEQLFIAEGAAEDIDMKNPTALKVFKQSVADAEAKYGLEAMRNVGPALIMMQKLPTAPQDILHEFFPELKNMRYNTGDAPNKKAFFAYELLGGHLEKDSFILNHPEERIIAAREKAQDELSKLQRDVKTRKELESASLKKLNEDTEKGADNNQIKLDIANIETQREFIKKAQDKMSPVAKRVATLDIAMRYASIENARTSGREQEADRLTLKAYEEYGNDLQKIDPGLYKDAQASLRRLREKGQLSPFEQKLFGQQYTYQESLKTAVDKQNELGVLPDVMDQLRARKSFSVGAFQTSEEYFGKEARILLPPGHDMTSGRYSFVTLTNTNGVQRSFAMEKSDQSRLEKIPKGRTPILLRDAEGISLTKAEGNQFILNNKTTKSYVLTDKDIGYADDKGNMFDGDGKAIDIKKLPDCKLVEKRLEQRKAFSVEPYQSPGGIEVRASRGDYALHLKTIKTAAGKTYEGLNISSEAQAIFDTPPPKGMTLILNSKREFRSAELASEIFEYHPNAFDQNRTNENRQSTYRKVLFADTITKDDLLFAKTEGDTLQVQTVDGKEKKTASVAGLEKQQDENARDVLRSLDQDPAVKKMTGTASQVGKSLQQLQDMLTSGDKGGKRQEFVDFAVNAARPTLDTINNPETLSNLQDLRNRLMVLKSGKSGIALGGLEQEIDDRLRAIEGFIQQIQSGATRKILETVLDVSKFDANTWQNWVLKDGLKMLATIAAAAAAAYFVTITFGAGTFVLAALAGAGSGLAAGEIVSEGIYVGYQVLSKDVRSGKTTYAERSLAGKAIAGQKFTDPTTGKAMDMDLFRDVYSPYAQQFAISFASQLVTMGLIKVGSGFTTKLLSNSKFAKTMADSNTCARVTEKLEKLKKTYEKIKAKGIKEGGLADEVGKEVAEEIGQGKIESSLDQMQRAAGAVSALGTFKSIVLGATIGTILGTRYRPGKGGLSADIATLKKRGWNAKQVGDEFHIDIPGEGIAKIPLDLTPDTRREETADADPNKTKSRKKPETKTATEKGESPAKKEANNNRKPAAEKPASSETNSEQKLLLRPDEELEAKLPNLKKDLGISLLDSNKTKREKLLNGLNKTDFIDVFKGPDGIHITNGNTRLFYAKKLGIPDSDIPVRTPEGKMMLSEYKKTPDTSSKEKGESTAKTKPEKSGKAGPDMDNSSTKADVKNSTKTENTPELQPAGRQQESKNKTEGTKKNPNRARKETTKTDKAESPLPKNDINSAFNQELREDLRRNFDTIVRPDLRDAVTHDRERIEKGELTAENSEVLQYMKSHDVDDNIRIVIAEKLLGKTLDADEVNAVMDAHNFTGDKKGNLKDGYDTDVNARKLGKLKQGLKFDRKEVLGKAKILTDAGVTGSRGEVSTRLYEPGITPIAIKKNDVLSDKENYVYEKMYDNGDYKISKVVGGKKVGIRVPADIIKEPQIPESRILRRSDGNYLFSNPDSNRQVTVKYNNLEHKIFAVKLGPDGKPDNQHFLLAPVELKTNVDGKEVSEPRAGRGSGSTVEATLSQIEFQNQAENPNNPRGPDARLPNTQSDTPKSESRSDSNANPRTPDTPAQPNTPKEQSKSTENSDKDFTSKDWVKMGTKTYKVEGRLPNDRYQIQELLPDGTLAKGMSVSASYLTRTDAPKSAKPEAAPDAVPKGEKVVWNRNTLLPNYRGTGQDVTTLDGLQDSKGNLLAAGNKKMIMRYDEEGKIQFYIVTSIQGKHYLTQVNKSQVEDLVRQRLPEKPKETRRAPVNPESSPAAPTQSDVQPEAKRELPKYKFSKYQTVTIGNQMYEVSDIQEDTLDCYIRAVEIDAQGKMKYIDAFDKGKTLPQDALAKAIEDKKFAEPTMQEAAPTGKAPEAAGSQDFDIGDDVIMKDGKQYTFVSDDGAGNFTFEGPDGTPKKLTQQQLQDENPRKAEQLQPLRKTPRRAKPADNEPDAGKKPEQTAPAPEAPVALKNLFIQGESLTVKYFGKNERWKVVGVNPDTQEYVLVKEIDGKTKRISRTEQELKELNPKTSNKEFVKNNPDLKDRLLSLPDTPEGLAERMKIAARLLRKESVTPAQEAAILKIHKESTGARINKGEVDAEGKPVDAKYDVKTLEKWTNELDAVGIEYDQATLLIRMGVCGSSDNFNIPPPPPPPLRPKVEPATPAAPAARPAIKPTEARIPPAPPPPPIKRQAEVPVTPAPKPPEASKATVPPKESDARVKLDQARPVPPVRNAEPSVRQKAEATNAAPVKNAEPPVKRLELGPRMAARANNFYFLAWDTEGLVMEHERDALLKKENPTAQERTRITALDQQLKQDVFSEEKQTEIHRRMQEGPLPTLQGQLDALLNGQKKLPGEIALWEGKRAKAKDPKQIDQCDAVLRFLNNEKGRVEKTIDIIQDRLLAQPLPSLDVQIKTVETDLAKATTETRAAREAESNASSQQRKSPSTPNETALKQATGNRIRLEKVQADLEKNLTALRQQKPRP